MTINIRSVLRTFLGKFKAPELPREQEVTVLVYLFLKRKPDIPDNFSDTMLYELWVDCRDTGQALTLSQIRKMLSAEQYQRFIHNQEIIHEIPLSKYRKWDKEPEKRLIHKPINPNDYSPQRGIKK